MIDGLPLFSRCRTAARTQLNCPVMFTASVRSHSSGGISSTRPVGPAMPALLTRQSRPPSASAVASMKRVTASRSDTSQTDAFTLGSLLASSASAVRSTSQICTSAPSRRKARATSRPMPAAPAVTIARKPLMPRSMTLGLPSIYLFCLHVTRRQAENLARFHWCRDLVAKDCDNLCRFLDQRRVAWRELALLQIDVVLKPDARMAAEQHGLRHHRELMQRNAEGKPRRIRRQQIAHIGHGLRRRRLAPGNAQANLKHAGRLDVAILDEALGEQQMPGLEHFELGHDAGILDRDRHRLQVLRR